MRRLRNPKQFIYVSFALLLFILFAATPIVVCLRDETMVEVDEKARRAAFVICILI